MLFLSLLPPHPHSLSLRLLFFRLFGRRPEAFALFSWLMHITAGVAHPSFQAKLSIYCALLYNVLLYSFILEYTH